MRKRFITTMLMKKTWGIMAQYPENVKLSKHVDMGNTTEDTDLHNDHKNKT